MSSPALCPVTVTRRTDMLAVVEGEMNNKITSRQIAEATKDVLPQYTPDNASAILVFHTASKTLVLGGLRANKALEGKKTSEGTDFPKQLNAATGGKSTVPPELPLRAAIVERVTTKMFVDAEFEGATALVKLREAIQADEGWESKACVHTDKWGEQEKDRMCVITAIKHIECSEADIEKLQTALNTIMGIKKEAGAKPWEVTDFRFVELQPIIDSSLASYADDELVKATKAYESFKDLVAVTFNDLAVATLAKNGAFTHRSYARLSLS